MRPARLMTAALAWALAAGLGAEPRVALLGNFPEEKVAETQVAQEALDAANALGKGPKLKLAIYNIGTSESSAASAAGRIAGDSDVLAVVLHGEAAASPGALAALKRAGLAVISASSMSQPRGRESGATWLCPSLKELAEGGAIYARREARAAQVAVIDDGGDTGVAAAHAFASRFRALGGKVPLETSWKGGEDGLQAALRGMAAHWPQMVFYTGDAESAARLVLAMREEKALKSADIMGLPELLDPAFLKAAKAKGARARALFPCPDYDGPGSMLRSLGFAFPRSSPEYKAYVHYAFRRPGRWTSMIFDGVALAARAVRGAEAEGDALPSREQVRLALDAIPSYRGIRGAVRFNAARQPAEPKVMVYFALNKVNRKDFFWKQKAFGPPFQ